MTAVLRETLELFQAPVYRRTPRTAETYKSVTDHCCKNLSRLVEEYFNVENNQQLLRELRNDIDYYLRRYHEYCIRQRDGMQAHYHEKNADADTDFEHLIPAARIRDLLLSKTISIKQALNAPTVKLSRHKHQMLKETGWASSTPDMWKPFRRYSQIFSQATFETYDGIAVDPESWTLDQHYKYFDYLVRDIND